MADPFNVRNNINSELKFKPFRYFAVSPISVILSPCECFSFHPHAQLSNTHFHSWYTYGRQFQYDYAIVLSQSKNTHALRIPTFRLLWCVFFSASISKSSNNMINWLRQTDVFVQRISKYSAPFHETAIGVVRVVFRCLSP